MVSVEKIKAGLAAYFDAELMPQLPANGWESIVVGASLGIILKRLDKIAESLANSPLAQMVEVVSSDGGFDLDAIRDEVKKQIESKGSLQIDNVPILKKLTFTAADIDKAYEHIMKG